MQLRVKYRPDGGIFPPRLKIVYSDVSDKTGNVEIDFSVVYEADDASSETWRITTR